jgi:type IV pilus assembly protein PilO
MTTVAEKKRTAVAAKQWTEKASRLGTLKNFHIAGAVALGLVNLYLLAHMAFAWRAANNQNAAALADQTVQMKTAEIARQPLEGLDEKLAQATKDADKFYKERLPFANSEVAGELGALAKKQGVKLTRVQYAYSPVMDGTAGALTEARMDASLSGDYRPLVVFINSLERDKMFFLISGAYVDWSAKRDSGASASADDIPAIAGGDGKLGQDCVGCGGKEGCRQLF